MAKGAGIMFVLGGFKGRWKSAIILITAGALFPSVPTHSWRLHFYNFRSATDEDFSSS